MIHKNVPVVPRRILSVLALSLALVASVTAAQASPSAAGRYIVVLKESAGPVRGVAADHASRFGAAVSHVYAHALRGYVATIPSGALGALRSDPRVAYVEADGVMRALTTQSGATWGLDRID